MKNDRLKQILLWTAIILLVPSTSSAYRPLATEDAGVAGKGVAQLETSWDSMKWNNGDLENVLLFAPIYGVTENLELSLEIPYMFHDPKEGSDENCVGDLNMVGKALLFEEKGAMPAFALKSVVKTPNGDEDDGCGSGDWDYSLVGVMSKSLNNFLFHAMAGYTFVGDNGVDDTRNIYLYGFAVDYGLTDTLHLLAEISGNRHPDRLSEKDPLAGLLGVTYRFSERVTFDGALRLGVTDAMPDWSSSAGMTVTF